MKLPIQFLLAARTEFDESADWYDKRSAGRGTLFTIAVDRIVDRIAEQPALYPIVRKNVRQAIVPKYPFCVYFADLGTHILVISVFHTARNPEVWQDRV